MEMAKTYQGYFQQGQFISIETVSIPDNVEVYVVVTDNVLTETKKTKSQKQQEAFQQFVAANRAITDEPFTKEYDAILASGVNIGRMLDL